MSYDYTDEFINLINANKAGNEASIKRQYQMAKLIGDLEQQNKIMLNALIEQIIFFDKMKGHMPHIFADDDRYRQNIKIIEKATDTPWQEIKELNK